MKALISTAAAMLAVSAYAQSATSPASAGTGSARSGISAGATGNTGASAAGTLPTTRPRASARPAPDPDGPLGAFWSQDSFRAEASDPQRLGGPIGVTQRPEATTLPSTTSFDSRNSGQTGQ